MSKPETTHGPQTIVEVLRYHGCTDADFKAFPGLLPPDQYPIQKRRGVLSRLWGSPIVVMLITAAIWLLMLKVFP